jgi:predicted SnoaL-like aldol condensation-catalyzing enzyme
VLSQVSSQKVKDEKLLENLSINNLENEKIEESKDILIGEYRQHKENVYVKIVKGNSIFNYHL